MRHRKSRLQLNRFTSWRRQTLVSLVSSLFIHQSIQTTRQKAYAVRPLAEKLISLGKENSLAAKRQAYRILGNHQLVSLLFGDIAPRFNHKIGGYTRIFNLGIRRGDNARMAILELTEIKKKERKKTVKLEKEVKPEETKGVREAKPTGVREAKPPITKRPKGKFLGGLRSIFKKERDSL